MLGTHHVRLGADEAQVGCSACMSATTLPVGLTDWWFQAHR